MAERIKRDAVGCRDQLNQAAAAAEALGAAWPAAAPSVAALEGAAANLTTSITDTDAKKDAWQVAGQLKEARVVTGVGLMTSVDEFTDALFGPGGAEKNNFGLVPKGAPMPPLHKLIEIEFTDGPNPGSLKADWESIEGASYEVQWSGTSNFAALIGSATSAGSSDYIISGLTPGTQYWMHVRPVRGGQMAEWSDPATRVAPV